MSRTAEARDLKFWKLVGGWDPNENYAKVGHRGLGAGSRILGPPSISGTAIARGLKFWMHIERWGGVV